MPRTKKTTTVKKTPSRPQARPEQVRVRVMRLFVGGPPVGETVTLTRSPYLNRLIRVGFLKRDEG